jgi:DNA repair protein RecN (Recombination protein N)
MLTQIHIRDLATIEELQLNILPHSTIITGETGAGKSIFLEAIELALGARGSANMIRPGKERADISLCFDLTRFPTASAWLKEHAFYQDNNECIIRRSMATDGRSRSYINGLPATQQSVRDLGELVFHLHGQYDQQVLLKSENQRDMLDRFGEHVAIAQATRKAAETCKTLERTIQALREKTAEGTLRSEYLRFQLDEFIALNLREGEWQELEAEHHKISHVDELLKSIEQALQQLSNDDHHSVLTALNNIRKTLEASQTLEKKSIEWLSAVDNALIQLNDLEAELSAYLESTEVDPERAQFLEKRVSQLYDLARKHKVKPEELVNYQQRLQTELDGLASSDEALAKLAEQLKIAESDYHKHAAKLSKCREKAAGTLAKTITKTIRSLSLPHAEFQIALEAEASVFSPHGNEKVVFIIKTNPDQTLQPLAKVVSGGELSRLSLAAHLALAHVTSTPTLIFDEVDTGVGGATAEKIGKLLRELGEAYQVFCVTHSPQVAACGHHHLLVEKYFIAKTTHTRLRYLDKQEKSAEIARMLGGEKITAKTLAHAEELLAGMS